MAGEPSVFRNLCFPLALIYNAQKLTDPASLELDAARSKAVMLKMLVRRLPRRDVDTC